MVRSTQEQAAANRERILGIAAQGFREHGFDGLGVAALMRSAGLTHGGFYSHFASKEELMALAVRRAVDDMLADWRRRAEACPGDPLGAITGPYLSRAHRDRPGTGCLMAALGPESARQPPQVRRAVTECCEHVLATLAALVPDPDPETRRRQAIRLFATLVGAMVVARAVDDPALSDTVLDAVRSDIGATPR